MQPSPRSIRGLIARGRSPALLAYALAGLAAVASFGSTLVLARLSGPAVIGAFALAVSTTNLLAGLAMLGLDRILVREVAGDIRMGDTARATAFVRVVALTVGVASIAIALLYWLALLFSPLLGWLGGSAVAMAVGGLAIVAIPSYRIAVAIVRAQGRQIGSQFFEALPTFGFAAAMATALVLGLTPSAPAAVGTAIAMQALAAIVAVAFAVAGMRSWDRGGAGVDRRLLVAGVPMMLILFLQMFADWLVLARISSTLGVADVGPFRVAIQVTTIIGTLLATTEAYVAARFAGDFRAGRPDLAWQRHRRATFLMAAVSLPLILVLLVAPEALLRLAFGPAFTGAATALAIMALGQLAAVARGPIGSMLSMAGHDRHQLVLTLSSLCLTAVLAFLLVPRMGLSGAAIAQAGPIVFRSGASYLLARRLIPRQRLPA